jgi:hypothetical protein
MTRYFVSFVALLWPLACALAEVRNPAQPGGWTRIDRSSNEGTSIEYVSHTQPVTVTVGHDPSGKLRSLMISRRPAAGSFDNVPPGDAQPPAGLLDLKSWGLVAPPAAPGSADHEVMLVSVNDKTLVQREATRLMRRHHSWLYIESRFATGRSEISSHDEQNGLHIGISMDAGGNADQLVIHSRWPAPHNRAQPYTPERKETILGETCTWFDMSPGMADASLGQCRTADGIVLKEERSSWMRREILQAVRLRRRPFDLIRVLPSRDLLMPRTWGLPH